MHTPWHLAFSLLLALGTFSSQSSAFDDAKTTRLRDKLNHYGRQTLNRNGLDKIKAARTVRLLVEEGADPHVADTLHENGSVALHYAVQWDDPELVRWLIAQGCNLRMRNKWHKCPAYFASSLNAQVLPIVDPNYNKTRKLLRFTRIIKLDEIETPDEITQTLTKIKKLITQGAEPYLTAEQCNILLYAIKYEDLELLNLIAQSPYFEPKNCPHCPPPYNSRIGYALKCQHQNIAQELVRLGTSLEEALLSAVQYKNIKFIRDLVNKGASINFSSSSKIYTILQSLEAGGEVANELVRLGAFAEAGKLRAPNRSATWDLVHNFQYLIRQTNTFNKYILEDNFEDLYKNLKLIIFDGENILFAAARLRNKELFSYLLKRFLTKGELYSMLHKPSTDNLSLANLVNNINVEDIKLMPLWKLHAEGSYWMFLIDDENSVFFLPREIWQIIFTTLSEIYNDDEKSRNLKTANLK